MPDFSLSSCVTLVFGRSGSGKTSFCFRYLVNAACAQPANANPTACIFIFDWKLEASQRLGLAPCHTQAQCETAIGTRAVVFNPHVMFPGDRLVINAEGEKVLNDEKMALRWFCQWVFAVSQRGPGKKILYIDELRNFVSKFSLFPEVSRIARMGRAEHLELLSSTQYPRDYHADLRGAVTEWVCFNTEEPAELDNVRPYFAGVDRVAALPRGSFIAYNRDSGAELAEKLF